MFNEMGHHPTLSVVSHFKKSNLPEVCRFFFGFILRCLARRIFGLDKAKLKFYTIIVGLYYGLNVVYASFL